MDVLQMYANLVRDKEHQNRAALQGVLEWDYEKRIIERFRTLVLRRVARKVDRERGGSADVDTPASLIKRFLQVRTLCTDAFVHHEPVAEVTTPIMSDPHPLFIDVFQIPR